MQAGVWPFQLSEKKRDSGKTRSPARAPHPTQESAINMHRKISSYDSGRLETSARRYHSTMPPLVVNRQIPAHPYSNHRSPLVPFPSESILQPRFANSYRRSLPPSLPLTTRA